MEKLSQMKNKFFKFLPKQPVASMAFQNPTMSPSTSVSTRGCRSHALKVSIVPKEARRKHRSGSFRSHEPTSPKVSCMGQVKCKKKSKAPKQKRVQETRTKKGDYVPCHEKKGKVLPWIFKGGSGEEQKQSGKGFVLEEKAPETVKLAPSLGAMKKFTSGRGSLCDFDVTHTER